MTRAGHILAGLLLTVVFAPGALAEVMDKEPPLLELWAWSTGLLGLCAVLAWRYPGLALVASVLPLTYGFAVVSELVDPYVGPAIRDEAGIGYVVQSFMLSGLCILAAPVLLVLLVVRIEQQRRQRLAR